MASSHLSSHWHDALTLTNSFDEPVEIQSRVGAGGVGGWSCNTLYFCRLVIFEFLSSILSLLNSLICSYIRSIFGIINVRILLAKIARPPSLSVVAISQITAQYSGLRSLVLAFPPVSRASIRWRISSDTSITKQHPWRIGCHVGWILRSFRIDCILCRTECWSFGDVRNS